jgi:hypothetical protein
MKNSSDENQVDWLADQIRSGGVLVLLETYADHIVIGIVRAGNLLVSIKKDANTTNYMLGIGFQKLDGGSKEQISGTVPSQNDDPTRSPMAVTFPLGNYRGLVEFGLNPHGLPSRSFRFHV